MSGNAPDNETYSPRYKKYFLSVLMGVSAFNFIDRQILVILQESIKADLSLSDTQLGLLTGFAFSLFYVSMGIPIARLADRFNRKNIISFCLLIWSGITFLSGFVLNFTQLLIARIGVGLGEAGCSPPSHSMISDYFPPEKRSTAMAVFSMGVYLGIMIGLLVGGVIDRYYGWRIAFMVVGLPGVFFALLIFLTVKEPDRGRLDQKEKSSVEALPFLSTVKIIFGHKTFIYLAFGGAAVAFVQYGIGNWIPPFLSRYHGLNSMQIGILTSLIFGLGGGLGTYLGGRWSDKLSRKDVAWYFRIPLYGSLIAIPFSVVLFFSHNVYLASFFLIFPVILNALYLAPSLAVAHNLVPAHMRALSSALFFFILNLIGLGMGPLMIGYMSDSLTGALGSESLRWSLAIATSVLLLAVFCYYRASQSIVREWKSELV